MKNQKKSRERIHQNEVNVKKSQKHEANLQKNSTLYFQVGLIVCLLFSYGLLEMKFETNAQYIGEVMIVDPDDFVINVNPVVEQPIVQQTVKQSVPKRLIDEYKTAPNDSEAQANEEIFVDPPTTEVPEIITDMPRIKPPVDIVDIPFDFVEVVPVFPGCEQATTNEERKACMSEKIAKHIRKKFDTDIASDLGIEGVQKINVMFKIDSDGNVTDIQARSPYKQLETEAIQVIAKLPKMIPGKQKDKNVSVIYGLPIKFSVQD